MNVMLSFKANYQHKDLENSQYREYRAFLEEIENWSIDQIVDYQIRQLNVLIRKAVSNTKGYAKLYADYGVSNLVIHDISDLQKLPFVDKRMLQKNVADFSITTNSGDYVTTGGSTGVPFGFFRSKLAFAKELASKAHQYSRFEWREGDRQIVFRGLPINTPEKYEFFPEFNELRLSSYHLTDEMIALYLDIIEHYKPHWIRCYPSSAQLLAQHLIVNGRRIDGLKGILCASENLYHHQIQLFKKAFSGKIFSHYGHYEQAVLAGFCEASYSYHVLPTYGVAELLDTNNSLVRETGMMGEIVGTSFTMDATLFIRYRTQDYAIFEADECHVCGRPYQCWEKIEGRLQDWVVSSSGRPVSMTAFNMHDTLFDQLTQFQFEQKELGKLVFKVIPKIAMGAEDVDRIRHGVMDKLGEGFDVVFDVVDEIPVTNRGKHRFLIQYLPLRFGDQGVEQFFSGECN